MSAPTFILYVKSPASSAEFYADLFSFPAIEVSPSFALLQISPGIMLGLWARQAVEPAAGASGVEGELAFSVVGNAEVDCLYADWSRRGLPMAQTPMALDFGYSFVALDPDGHRLRVFAPSQK